MINIFTIPADVVFGQLMIGMINGSFYALLSLGIAIIFGLLNIINFVHGAQYMLGAFVAWWLLNQFGLGYGWSLVIAPLVVGLFAIVIERLLLSRLSGIDHIYGLLLTLGLALVIEGVLRSKYGVSGLPYGTPAALAGGVDLGFMYLPLYRAWVVGISLVVCLATWLLIEKTRIGAYLRAATENPATVETFGINVPLLLTLAYGFGVALAALGGVLAAPIYSVSPAMGTDLIITVFAVVVIGGMGSILGSILTGFAVGIVEGLTRAVYPEASSTVVFLLMAVVLLVKPAGLFGKASGASPVVATEDELAAPVRLGRRGQAAVIVASALVLGAAPFFFYPMFVMQVLCAGLFAASFILLFGYGGMLSFGHAAFFGIGSYITAHAAKAWNVGPELAVLAGLGAATVLGVAFAALSIRRQGIYFAMITLALAQLVYFICLQAPFTGGEDGIRAVPRGHLLGVLDLQNEMSLYAFVAAVVASGMLLIFRVVSSPFGHVLRAIRDNEPRAASLGYRTTHYKFIVFVVAAALAGLAGSLKALVFQFASLADVHWLTSVDVVLMALIGGFGSIWGAVAGAVALTSLHTFVAHLGAWVTVIHGLVFVACVMLLRGGVVGMVANLRRRIGALRGVPLSTASEAA
ncbi:MAG: inner-rane translocator 24 [Ramlibacter sp.]|nr:inner-rane translocator 24 [Ramlibacter sp.]